MRNRHNRRHQHRHGVEQFDLFREADNERGQRPAWDALPPQTRQTLMDLMARLIFDHKENGRHSPPMETRHDV